MFIGSSSRARKWRAPSKPSCLPHCEVELWRQGAFEPGGYTLDSWINKARQCDFAVMVATPDDWRESRERQAYVPRDNVILEFGLFAGLLGRDRTYLLATTGLQLPTDTLGRSNLDALAPALDC